MSVRISPAGDEAVLVEFGDVIDRKVNARVRGLSALLERSAAPGVPDGQSPVARSSPGSPPSDWLLETVPAYASLLIRYSPERIDYNELIHTVERLAKQARAADAPPGRLVEVPVRYGGEDGADLAFVAEHAGLSEADVIAMHSGASYVVYMLGFTPGFCYLGDLPEPLWTPRRETPRLALPAGAVAIGGAQTGIYSLDNSPGGWRWIGRTPLPLWDPDAPNPFALQAGDEVRFVPE